MIIFFILVWITLGILSGLISRWSRNITWKPIYVKTIFGWMIMGGIAFMFVIVDIIVDFILKARFWDWKIYG